MLKATIDGASIRNAIAVLKDVDSDIQKKIAGDLKLALGDLASQMAHEVPVDAPLSGMNNNGRLRWGKVGRPLVSVTPGRSKGIRKLVAIHINVRPEAGYRMAELAGTRSTGTGAGVNMINVLRVRAPYQGKGGRFAFKKFRELRPEVLERTKKILNNYLELVNKKI